AVNKAGMPQRLKMLRRVCHRYARFVGERFDSPFTLSQQFEEFDAKGTRQRLTELGEVAVEAVLELPVGGGGHNQVIKRLLDHSRPLSSAFSRGWQTPVIQTLRRKAANSQRRVRLVLATP